VRLSIFLDFLKKLFFINLENCTDERRKFLNENFNIKHFNATNHKKECYKNFIPYVKYELISDETNNVIPDKHISRNGHKELAKDLMREIEKQVF